MNGRSAFFSSHEAVTLLSGSMVEGTEPTMNASPSPKKVYSRYISAKETGDNSQVGVFVPLPEEIASQFPDKAEDKSAPHVTLCYIGPVPREKRDLLVEALKEFYSRETGPIKAMLSHVDCFRSETGKVVYSRVVFSKDMGSMRDRLKSFLEDKGIEVKDSHPLAFTPHATIAYLEDPFEVWEGNSPIGSWSFDTVEVWGMKEVHKFQLGSVKPSVYKREMVARLVNRWQKSPSAKG